MSTVYNCPACGVALRVEAMGSGAGNWQRGQAFALGDAPPGAELTRETPTGQADTVESGVKVPLLQAVITGAVAGVVSVIPTVYYDWAWTVPPAVTVGTFGLSWWLLLQDTRRLLRRIEVWTGKDLDGDGQVGFSVEITESLADGRKRMTFARFPAKPEQVKRFAMAALNDRLTVHGNHRLTRGVFERLRDEAVARGLCAWKNPEAHTRGVELTRAGEHVFKRLLNEELD